MFYGLGMFLLVLAGYVAVEILSSCLRHLVLETDAPAIIFDLTSLPQTYRSQMPRKTIYRPCVRLRISFPDRDCLRLGQ